MKHMLGLCAVLLLFGTNVALASPHKVKVLVEGPQADAVASALKARINGTERYQTTDDIHADLVVSVLCTSMERYRITGAVCSYSFVYIPPSAPLLWLHIGIPGQVEAPQRGQLAEMIFQAFVEGTTEDKIQEQENNLKSSVATFCSDSVNELFCKLKK
ncbi:MAG: hypothetical protein ACHQLQ_03990 [Candidatus Acidiferrales bacterium]